MAYDVLTDRTVYDKVTKLTWEGLVDNRTVPQEEAARYCANKAGGGWRLPTLLELISLVDVTIPSGPMVFAVDPYSLRSIITGGYDSSKSPEARNARPFVNLRKKS